MHYCNYSCTHFPNMLGRRFPVWHVFLSKDFKFSSKPRQKYKRKNYPFKCSCYSSFLHRQRVNIKCWFIYRLENLEELDVNTNNLEVEFFITKQNQIQWCLGIFQHLLDRYEYLAVCWGQSIWVPRKMYKFRHWWSPGPGLLMKSCTE